MIAFKPVFLFMLTGVIFLGAAKLILESLIESVSRLFRLCRRWFVKSAAAQDVARSEMHEASSYTAWKNAALQLDRLQGRQSWWSQDESVHFNAGLIAERLSYIRGLKQINDQVGLVRALRCGLLRNLGGMLSPPLFQHARSHTKFLIEDYVNTVAELLDHIGSMDVGMGSFQEKISFFRETRQAFGRTALLLSGGAALGMYHLGVVKALLSEKLLPRVISGSSAGSLVCALVAVMKDDELAAVLHHAGGEGAQNPQNPRNSGGSLLNFDAFEKKTSSSGFATMWRRIKRWWNKGVLLDIRVLEENLRSNIGDITFREAYERTNRILNITVTSTSHHEMPRLLNYLSSPDVLIWSAACASCAIAGIYDSVELLAKDARNNIYKWQPSGLKWSDGSIESDLPMQRLSELFNVNYFIVSQVNPQVAKQPNKNTEKLESEKSEESENTKSAHSKPQYGVGPHTDMGFLTMLLQDSCGGLSVRAKNNEWIEAPPIPDTLVVNLGDMLERWTRGVYRATLHRVTNPTNRNRFSFPLFLDPAYDCSLTPIPESMLDLNGVVSKYERWDGRDLDNVPEGWVYGTYLLSKVSLVFPELFGAYIQTKK